MCLHFIAKVTATFRPVLCLSYLLLTMRCKEKSVSEVSCIYYLDCCGIFLEKVNFVLRHHQMKNKTVVSLKMYRQTARIVRS